MAYLHVNFYSEVLVMNTSMNVILPQRRRKEDDRCFPVLLLLHGMSDDYTAWMRYTAIERYAEEAGIAVIMPNGGLSWYADTATGLEFRRFIGEEVLRVARRMFPALSARREDTWIAGNSMGGYGAMAVGLTYPETFSKIGAIAGALIPPKVFPGGESAPYIGRPRAFFEDIFGDLDAFFGTKNDLCALAQEIVASGKPMPRIYQTVGTADCFYKDNTEMHRALTEIGMDITYAEVPDAYHHWRFWDLFIQPVIKWLTTTDKEGV